MQLKQGGSFTRLFFLGAPGLTPAATISKAGAPFAAPTNAVVEISDGWYGLDLVAGDLDTLGQLAYHLSVGTPADFEDQVSAQVLGDDLNANVKQWLNAAVMLQAGTFPKVFVESMQNDCINFFSFSNGAVDKIVQGRILGESYAADGAPATLAQLLYMLLSALAEFSIAGTTIVCKKLDGVTPSMSYTLDSATAPSSRTRSG